MALGQCDYIRSNLVSRIFAYHMQNGLVSSRVVFEPPINLENVLVKNEHLPSIRNHCLNIPSGHEGIGFRFTPIHFAPFSIPA